VDSSKAQSVVEPQQDSDEEEEEKLAPFLETVNEKQAHNNSTSFAQLCESSLTTSENPDL